MQKILFVFSLVFIGGAAIAATTCIHNRTHVFVLKRSVNGISSSYDAAQNTWSVTFDYDLVPNNSSYRKITGNATCNEINTDAAGSTAKIGSSNVYLRASSADVGIQCWCSMMAPISSWWVFYKQYDSEDACAAGCARDCATAVKSNTNNFRSNGVYSAIW